MKKSISISESEWIVMKTIWGDSSKTLPEILNSLKHTGWSTTTIQTYLARLVKKGALSTQRQGKGYLYSLDCRKRIVRYLRAKIFKPGIQRLAVANGKGICKKRQPICRGVEGTERAGRGTGENRWRSYIMLFTLFCLPR